MPKTCRITDDLSTLGVLITAAHGLDTDWMDDAVCRDYPSGRTKEGKTPWMASEQGDYAPGVKGKDMCEAARIVCFGCPVQWQCAEYAARGEMTAGTWGGLTGEDLRWFRKLPDERVTKICAAAQVNGVKMSDAIRTVRFGSY